MTSPESSKKTIKGITETVNDIDPMAELRSKLKACDLEIQHYVTALEKENLKCAKKIAKLQADNATLNSRINVLSEEQYRPKIELKINDIHKNLPEK